MGSYVCAPECLYRMLESPTIARQPACLVCLKVYINPQLLYSLDGSGPLLFLLSVLSRGGETEKPLSSLFKKRQTERACTPARLLLCIKNTSWLPLSPTTTPHVYFSFVVSSFSCFLFVLLTNDGCNCRKSEITKNFFTHCGEEEKQRRKKKRRVVV